MVTTVKTVSTERLCHTSGHQGHLHRTCVLIKDRTTQLHHPNAEVY